MKVSSIKKCLGVLGTGLFASASPLHAEPGAGAVYTMDNAAGANHVLAFDRAANGSLTGPTVFWTGGAGTGAGLSSQGALLLTDDKCWLFVCNAGSDEVSVFAVSPGGLQLTDKQPSGGRVPLSLTLNHDLLYVLNAGG